MITLDIISPNGERERKSFDTAPVSIGRQVGQLRIQDPGVSALHGQLAVVDGVLCYRDLGSTNGSFGADGTPIESSMNLETGDRVRLGEHELCLVEFTSAPAPTPDPTNQTMAYPPSRAPWSKSPSVGPSWKAQSEPSESAPQPAPAPAPPREMPAPEGTIFGLLDTKSPGQAPALEVGNKTQIIAGPDQAASPNYTQPIAPPPSRGTPITFQTAEHHQGVTPAAPQEHAANASIMESLGIFARNALGLLLSGPALWLCGGCVALSLAFSQGVANSVLTSASIGLGLVGLWSLLPGSIAAAQLLSQRQVTPVKNWMRALALPLNTQLRWCGLILAFLVASVVVVPLFLCFPFAAPALLLEKKGVITSLRRSASLVSWYPVSSMLPLLFVILSLPASWLALERIVALAQIQLDPSAAAIASLAAIASCALLVCAGASFYLLHVFRVYFFHLSVHDPEAKELDPMPILT